ncbi:replication initiator [Streptosporangium soli]|nr:hypothetical protein [Streptosporangium sp. KLBMP 9127]
MSASPALRAATHCDHGGHFSARSRHYSTTLTLLRAARRAFTRTEEITTGRLPLFDEDTAVEIATWQYAGKGWSAGDALLAAALTGTSLDRREVAHVPSPAHCA